MVMLTGTAPRARIAGQAVAGSAGNTSRPL
jgi:hypothetical protein